MLPAVSDKCLLDALCGISRDCNVDWEIWAVTRPTPGGGDPRRQCIDDPEAHADAVRGVREAFDRRAGG